MVFLGLFIDRFLMISVFVSTFDRFSYGLLINFDRFSHVQQGNFGGYICVQLAEICEVGMQLLAVASALLLERSQVLERLAA